MSHLNLTKENKPPEGADERERKEYEDLLAQGLFDGQEYNKVLNFNAPPPAPTVGGFQRGLREVSTLRLVPHPCYLPRPLHHAPSHQTWPHRATMLWIGVYRESDAVHADPAGKPSLHLAKPRADPGCTRVDG